MPTARLEFIALDDMPSVANGDDLAALVIAACSCGGLRLGDGDVLVVAQKIVSKAEGRLVQLADVKAGAEARRLAAETGKDARIVELILQESRSIIRARPGLIIAEHRLGFIMANAGIDQSNTGTGPDMEAALLLPIDPDASAAALRQALGQAYGANLGVIINDSFGRPWRCGTAGVAIGVAGLPALIDLRGRPDLDGRELLVSITGFADEISAGASLLMGQGDEGRPVVLVRGLTWHAPTGTAADLIRPAEGDLFR